MASNAELDAMLVAYADGELDATAAAEVEAYIAATPAAQRTLAIYRETAALLRAAFAESRYAPADRPPDFLASLPMPNPPSRRSRVPRYAWAVAASVVMAVIGYAGRRPLA